LLFQFRLLWTELCHGRFQVSFALFSLQTSTCSSLSSGWLDRLVIIWM
jgi:hypothetical protein